MNNFFDPVREKNVCALPEEVVRQKLIQVLIEMGYPRSLIAVELNISQLKHVSDQDICNYKRRADIICFAKNIHEDYDIYPLLLIECKACRITSAVFRQVEGYNSVVKSYFYTVANDDEIYTCWIDPSTKKTKKIPRLPRYNELLSAVNGQ